MEINNEYINDSVDHLNWYYKDIYKDIESNNDLDSVDYIISSRDLACRFVEDTISLMEIADQKNISYELSTDKLAIIGKIYLDLKQNKHVQDILNKK